MGNASYRFKLYISIAIIGLIALASFSIIFFGVYQVYYAPASLFRQDFSSVDEVDFLFGERSVNVVLLGLHNREDDNTFGDIYYVDTILIAAVNFDHNSLTLVAVPRDSYVEIHNSQIRDRIRQSYRYGYERSTANRHDEGLNSTLETIRSLLAPAEINYYVAMDIQGLKQLIDSMGGVYYTVEEPMVGFTEQESLDAGSQLLDGQGYINYLTYREVDSRDDMNRMKRQKALLRATFDYFQEMGLFRYVIPTYAAYRDHIRTNLSFNQVAALILFAGDRLEADAIYDYSLSGEYFTLDYGDTYYLLVDERNKQEIIQLL